MVKDKAFYFLALDRRPGNLQRPNLSESIGRRCPVAARRLLANETLIGANADCQRPGAASGSFQSRRNQNEGLPIDHTINNNAMLAKVAGISPPQTSCPRRTTSTIRRNVKPDLRRGTYGTSANGIEGPSEDQRAQRESVHHPPPRAG